MCPGPIWGDEALSDALGISTDGVSVPQSQPNKEQMARAAGRNVIGKMTSENWQYLLP